MKAFMVYLILGSLLGIIPPSLSAQQNQSPQHSAQELEALKNRVSELEKQFGTVENVEKMELQSKLAEANAKLTDANAKLANVQFDRFKQDLRVDNDDRMRAWSYWFFGILGVIVLISGAAIWFSLKSLISDRVEKNLNGFKEGLEEVDTLKNEIGVLKDQQRVLEREHTTATLEDFIYDRLWRQQNHPEQIKGLREESLLEVFGDKGRIQAIRYKAAEILAARKSPRLVSPVLEHLNSIVDSDADLDFETENILLSLTNYLGDIHTKETYEGLIKFLNRLLTENPKHKELFITATAFSLAMVSIKLNLGNSVSMLKLAIPQLNVGHNNQQALKNLARQFDIFNEPEGIKEMLTTHGQSLPSEVVDTCLDLLQKHNPEFVENWRTQNTTNSAES